ncbi:MAG: hypothetical protein ACTHNS_02075 [Marmoricola sp.]
MERIKEMGVSLSLIAHGSDVRDPERHADHVDDSYFAHIDPTFARWLIRRSASNRKLALSCGRPVFVSTPDLLLDIPGAQWLPLSVDVGQWAAPERRGRGKPRVLHAPSSALKGSDVIDPVLEDLAAAQVIEYVRLDRVAHEEMPALVATADIVVDQIRTGSYGVAAVEAMVSGAVVVGFLSPTVRALLPADPGIVDAPPRHFEGALRGLLASRGEWPSIVASSQAYARTWHNGVRSAEVLSSIIGTD